LDAAWYSNSSAGRIADLVNARELSAVEVVRAALQRLEVHEPTLRAFRHWWPDVALREAGSVDRRIAGGERLPLAGVPLAVKAVEPLDSVQPARLRAAGCVALGATSVPGPGTAWQTWGMTERGRTENPWVPGLSPGGSSAGSAAAVAARVVHLATGIDGAGSIRIPAAWCGVLGLKITAGVLATRDRGGLAAPGPLCHETGDAVLYLDALMDGPAPHRPVPRRPARVGWSSDLGFADVDRDQQEIARAALDRLLDADELIEHDHDLRLRDPAPVWTAARTGVGSTEVDEVRNHNRGQLTRAFEAVDLLATPTTPGPPHPHTGPGSRFNTDLTWAFNISGHPAMSLPAGLDGSGRPVGLHLVARHGHERVLLAVAASYQRIYPEAFDPPTPGQRHGSPKSCEPVEIAFPAPSQG
jgi:Asp-tRNA(Asn)/Glu-tRNA(Gln) amidotransferase A subunit family amidase